MSASAVYEGWIRHRRFEPVEHEFRYRLFLMYLDLDELPGVLDPYPLWSARRRAPARFRRADFMGDPERPLAECARDAVEAATGARPAGPVRLLASLRYLGHSFNPVSFYYCFDSAGERVEAVVADVKNIPWGERHPYVLARGEREGPVLSDELDKTLHVSPLMGMDQTYAFRASEPGERLAVHIESRPDARRRRGKSFDATLSLRRRELSRPLLTADAGPLPGDVAAGRGEDLRAVAAAEAEGRALLPPPRGEAAEGVRLAVRDALARAAVSARRCAAASAPAGSRWSRTGAGARFGPADADLRATVTIHDPAAWRGPLRGSVGLGETYVDGLWETDDLVALIRIAARELRDLDGLRGAVARPRGLLHRVRRLVPENTRTRRPQQHLRPLRPRQRPLRRLPRRADDVLLRLLPERGREPRGGAAGEARADLRAAAARPREPPAGDRQRLGRARRSTPPASTAAG